MGIIRFDRQYKYVFWPSAQMVCYVVARNGASRRQRHEEEGGAKWTGPRCHTVNASLQVATRTRTITSARGLRYLAWCQRSRRAARWCRSPARVGPSHDGPHYHVGVGLTSCTPRAGTSPPSLAYCMLLAGWNWSSPCVPGTSEQM
jgi:hypothetical protein